MEKKKYVVPSTVVMDLKHQAHLLSQSPEGDPEPQDPDI